MKGAGDGSPPPPGCTLLLPASVPGGRPTKISQPDAAVLVEGWGKKGCRHFLTKVNSSWRHGPMGRGLQPGTWVDFSLDCLVPS